MVPSGEDGDESKGLVLEKEVILKSALQTQESMTPAFHFQTSERTWRSSAQRSD